jgi:hypothetical protein
MKMLTIIVSFIKSLFVLDYSKNLRDSENTQVNNRVYKDSCKHCNGEGDAMDGENNYYPFYFKSPS